MPAARWLPALLLLITLLAPGCNRYDQGTPEGVLKSAQEMVKNGDVEYLTQLIYADSTEMRQLLDQVGLLLGSLRDLGDAVQKAYPKEIEDLKTRAAASAKEGQASSAVMELLNTQRPRAQRRTRPRDGSQGGPGVQVRVESGGAPSGADPDRMRQVFDDALKEIFADPYAWVRATESRLTVQTLTDDTAALLWDNKPVFGVGLLMKKDKGKWYILLPTNVPGLGRALPKSPETWEIMGSLVDVFDNMFRDLERDVRRGKLATLDDVGRSAGEKAFIPAVMVFLAYGRALEAENDAQKAEKKPAAPAPAAPTGSAPPAPAPAGATGAP